MIDDDDLPDVVVDDDSGLDEGTVLVATHRSGGQRKYHTDEDCRYVNDDHKEWDRDEAEDWGFELCRLCSGDMPNSGYDAR